MCNTCGALIGVVNEIAIRRQIGLEFTVAELGTNSSHFSTERLVTGEKNSSREMEVDPTVFADLDIGKWEGEWEMSSKRRCPLGSQ